MFRNIQNWTFGNNQKWMSRGKSEVILTKFFLPLIGHKFHIRDETESDFLTGVSTHFIFFPFHYNRPVLPNASCVMEREGPVQVDGVG